MSVIADLPAVRPGLLLDFANSRKVHPHIQCTRASTATCYGPDGKLRTVAANVPRIDFDPATGRCLGLLAEGARTNTALNSSDFTAASWSKLRTTATAPDSDGWCKITEDTTATTTHTVYSTITTAGATTYTFSIDVKTGTRNIVNLTFGNFAAQEAAISVFLNMDTGALSGTIAGRYTLVKLPDGWRISITTTTIASPGVNILASVQLAAVMGSSTYTGDGVSHIYVRNAQIEVGAYPSSYIPTTTASATRAADVLLLDAYEYLASNGYSISLEGMSDYVVEYPCIFSDSPTALGNYVGPRMGSGGYYINSTEGGRSAALARPAAGTWMRFAAAVANDTSGGVGLDGAAGAGVARTTADFKTRRYLKFGTTSSAAGGVWRIGRLALYGQVLTAAQLQRLTLP